MLVSSFNVGKLSGKKYVVHSRFMLSELIPYFLYLMGHYYFDLKKQGFVKATTINPNRLKNES